MSQPASLTRRSVLKALGATPVLPIAASFAGELPAANGRHGASAANRYVTYEFGAMAAPSLAEPAQMATTYVASTVTKRYGRNHAETYSLGYETFFLTGEVVPATGGGTIVAGGYYDINGNPILDVTSPDQRQFFSDCPDGMSLIELGASGRGRGRNRCNRIFAVVQFEYVTRNAAQQSMYGLLPSPIAILTLDQDPRTGRLSHVSYHNVDTSGVRGLWITCGASRSPWNTHLARSTSPTPRSPPTRSSAPSARISSATRRARTRTTTVISPRSSSIPTAPAASASTTASGGSRTSSCR
ncbi:MAG: hypothetical protein U1F09_00755 [Steroidobacteraceae bacterium]